MPAIKTPKGWSVVTDWPLKRAPMFQRIGIPGLMWIYRIGSTYSLEIQGHSAHIVEGDLETVVAVADEWDTAHNLRVCGMSDEEFAQEFYGRALIAFNALADGDPASIETSREQIGKMEAFLHDLRGRLRSKEPKETYASRAERRSAEMKLVIHEFYTWLLYGHLEATAVSLGILEKWIAEMKQEIAAEKTASKKQAS